jgi:hypothetical protein
MNLYQATELARLESHVDEETGEIDLAAFDAAQIALLDKQRAVVAFVRNAEAHEAMLADAIKQLQAKQKTMKAKGERLKTYLLENMRAAGISKIEAADGTFSATLYPQRDASVVIEDGAIFPPELCADPKPPEPSKTKIKAAIEAGHDVPGASIVKNDRLTIK